MGSTYPAGFTDVQGETQALTTSRASLGIPPGVVQALMFNPIEDYRMRTAPPITDIRFYDASNSLGSRYEKGDDPTFLRDLLDRTTGTGTGTALDSSTTSDFLYINLNSPTLGIRIVMNGSSLNGTASTLTAEYRQNDDSWTDLSATDGTRTGGDTTFGQTGDITWTAVTNWLATDLHTIEFAADSGAKVPGDYADASKITGYWMRLSWSVALDSDTEIENIWALPVDTTRGYFSGGVEYELSFDRQTVGALDWVTTANTDTLRLTWMRARG